jgi:hypothetical protein
MSGQNRRASKQNSIPSRRNRPVASEEPTCCFGDFSLSRRGGDFSSKLLFFGSENHVLRSRNLGPRRENVACRREKFGARDRNVALRSRNFVLRPENLARDSEEGRFPEHRHGVREQAGRPGPRERRLSSRRCDFPLHEVEIRERSPEFFVAGAGRCSRTRRLSSRGRPPARRTGRFSFQRDDSDRARPITCSGGFDVAAVPRT